MNVIVLTVHLIMCTLVRAARTHSRERDITIRHFKSIFIQDKRRSHKTVVQSL